MFNDLMCLSKTLVLDQMLTKVRSQPLGLDQSLDLSLVLDQIAGVRSNSV